MGILRRFSGSYENVQMISPRAVLLLLCLCVKLSLTFNVDTKFPILYDMSVPGREKYFGYSVAFHKNSEGYLALIAGPKANSSISSHRKIKEPGVLYKCPITPTKPTISKCKEVVVDSSGNLRVVPQTNSPYSYQDTKDGMWLGVSMDVQITEPHRVVVCGHLWKNSIYMNQLLANGVCYLLNQDLTTYKKLLPLINRKKQSIIPPGIYLYALAQAGISASFNDNGEDLLLGAPGYHDWLGTVVEYKFNNKTLEPKVPNTVNIDKVSPESYIGYSVASGRFFQIEGTYYVTGAPRDAGNKGRVYIFQKFGVYTERFIIQTKMEGEQLGEYFGATLLGVNIDNDQFTDLIVGAPLHSLKNGGDEGRIYVYYSDGVGLQLQQDVIMGAKKAGARFGSSIANLNDINQDGFTDIAVGAPYEEEETGAVYIYHGTKGGLKPQYSQRILAKDLDTGLKGFGSSISRAMDIDNNLYPDLLIGAYSSDRAVVLRSRPVIQVSAKVEFNISQIDVNKTLCRFKGRNVSCFQVSACLKYNGKHISEFIDFLVKLDLDVGQEANQRPKRGYFFHENRVTTSLLEGVSLQLGKFKCFERLVHVHNDIQDFISPMIFQMNYSLARDIQPEEAFCGSCPLLDPGTQTSIANEIFFRTGCGDDNTCTSDLKVKASVVGLPQDEPIILGANDSITVDVRVENLGEAAYASTLSIELPQEVLIINQAHCHIVDVVEGGGKDDATDLDKNSINEKKSSNLECKLGNPLPNGATNAFQIKLDVSKLDYTITEIILKMEALTASEEKNRRDNLYYLRVPFAALADITIRGHAEREQIVYQSKADLIPMVHKYVVLKYLPSPIKSVGVAIYLPLTDRNTGVKMVRIQGVEIDGKSSVTGTCNVTQSDSFESKIDLDYDNGESPVHVEDRGGKDAPNTINDLDERSKRSIQSKDENQNPSPAETKTAPREKREDKWWDTGNENFIMNCTTMICQIVVCTVGPFIDTNKVATIKIETLANMTAIKSVLGDTGNITFVTEGKVWIRDPNYKPQPPDHRPDFDYAVTSLISPHQPTKPIDNWIIAVAVGAGFLLLALILLALVQLGFFRRKQREDMQKMMQEASLISEKSVDNDNESNADKDEFDYINFANSNT